VNQLAGLVEIAHHHDTIFIEMGNFVLIIAADDGILKSWSCNAVFTDELHGDHIVLQEERPWSSNLSTLTDSLKISYFLLGPLLDHLSRVSFTVATSETEFSAYISLTILKDENTGFENLNGELKFGLIFFEHLEGAKIFASAFS